MTRAPYEPPRLTVLDADDPRCRPFRELHRDPALVAELRAALARGGTLVLPADAKVVFLTAGKDGAR